MVATGVKGVKGWVIAVNDKGEEDWTCPKCGHELSSCCGNSHIWCYNCGYTLWTGPPPFPHKLEISNFSSLEKLKEMKTDGHSVLSGQL